jgi:hypothetical protein
MTVEVELTGVYTIDLLYTSNRGGKISLDLNGKPLVSSIDIISTSTDNDPIAWRQWHHWNVMTNLAEVELPKGVSILTLHIVTEGNMNLDCLVSSQKINSRHTLFRRCGYTPTNSDRIDNVSRN